MDKQKILGLTKFKEELLPTKYLGVPLMQGMVKITYFNYIMEKMQARISGWIKSLLSMARRLTMVSSVLSSMSLHVMSVLSIPKEILNKMDSLIANFFYGEGVITISIIG